MKQILSKVNPDKILHILRRRSELENQDTQRVDLSPTNQFLQVASLKMQNETTFKAHEHIWRKGEEEIIPQESWVVIKGSVQTFYYDTDGKLLASELLEQGDISITFEGGHNYLIRSDNTLVYEFKSARYYGVEKDKRFI
jgi:hypothetical protein